MRNKERVTERINIEEWLRSESLTRGVLPSATAGGESTGAIGRTLSRIGTSLQSLVGKQPSRTLVLIADKSAERGERVEKRVA